MSLLEQAALTPPLDLRPTVQRMWGQDSTIRFLSSPSPLVPKFPVGPKYRLRALKDADHKTVADLIALGAAMAIGTCGGPPIPLRGGRIDATEAGASGVCEPETDLQTTLAIFSGAGFDPADTIALTACGHTMGGYVCRLTLKKHL